jgi:hypothetical protein
MKRRVSLAAVSVALALAGCGAQGPPTVGQQVSYANVCDKSNEGKRVAVVGYLRLPQRFKLKEDTASLRLYGVPEYDSRHVRVATPFGTGPNQVRKPGDKYGDLDLQVHLADGGTATFGTPVRVSGDMYIPMVAQTGPDGFDCGLENPLIEKAPPAAAAR